jgi:hypothetical protein
VWKGEYDDQQVVFLWSGVPDILHAWVRNCTFCNDWSTTSVGGWFLNRLLHSSIVGDSYVLQEA